MVRIFRRDVHLTPDTTVAAWDPHNGFGDVNVKDVYLIQLKDVDFKGRGYRNLVIPEEGYVTVYKTEQGYRVVDVDAEAGVKQAKRDAITNQNPDEFVEKILDDWDAFLNSRGFSFVGESDVYTVYANADREADANLVAIDKNKLKRFVKSGENSHLRNYVEAGRIEYEGDEHWSVDKDLILKENPAILAAVKKAGIEYIVPTFYYSAALNPKIAYKSITRE